MSGFLFGAVVTTNLGEITSTITSSGSDSIVYDEGIFPVDMSDPFVSKLLYLQNLGVTHRRDLISNTIVAKENQPTTLDKLNIVADSIDTLTITGAPTNSTIQIKGKLPNNTAFSETCSDPETFSTEIPDTYTLTISCFPYLDFTATIEAI